jgi:RluA family pseudouridine synthase
VVTVPAALDEARLDRAIRQLAPTVGRARVGRLISVGAVRVRGRVVRLSSWQVHTNDRIEIAMSATEPIRDEWTWNAAWIIEFDEARDLLVLDKPSGLRSEPTRAGDHANALTLAASAGFEGMHLVHRLDRDTSGVVVLAGPVADRRELDRVFQERLVDKTYIAVVDGDAGALSDEGELRHRLDRDPARRDQMIVVSKGGDGALTRYRVLSRSADQTVVELHPLTGRTHQLRVQLGAVGSPILGDRLYGSDSSAPRLMLHALSLVLPIGSDTLRFEAPLPPEFG